MSETKRSKTKIKHSLKGYHYSGGIFTTHNCKPGEWWGIDICEELHIDEMIDLSELKKGKRYKITVKIEEIED